MENEYSLKLNITDPKGRETLIKDFNGVLKGSQKDQAIAFQWEIMSAVEVMIRALTSSLFTLEKELVPTTPDISICSPGDILIALAECNHHIVVSLSGLTRFYNNNILVDSFTGTDHTFTCPETGDIYILHINSFGDFTMEDKHGQILTVNIGSLWCSFEGGLLAREVLPNGIIKYYSKIFTSGIIAVLPDPLINLDQLVEGNVYGFFYNNGKASDYHSFLKYVSGSPGFPTTNRNVVFNLTKAFYPILQSSIGYLINMKEGDTLQNFYSNLTQNNVTLSLKINRREGILTSAQSSYQLWLASGNTGTEEDYFAYLKGPGGVQGPAGPAGAPGLSAYQLWQNLGNAGTVEDFLAAMGGPQGPPGPQGPIGPAGLTWKSSWVDSNYLKNDCVVYNGSCYVCIKDTVSRDLPTNTEFWDIALPKNQAVLENVANVGTTGLGLFKQKVGQTAELRNLAPGSAKLTLQNNLQNDTIEIDLAESNIGINNLNGAPSTTVVGVSDAQVLENKTLDSVTNQVTANKLRTADGTAITVTGSTPPVAGDILVAVSSGAAEWQPPATPYYIASETNGVSTSNRNYSIIPGMSLTPAAGTYLASFSSYAMCGKAKEFMDVAIFIGATIVPHSLRRQYAADKKSYNWQSIHTQAIVTITGGDVISIKWKGLDYSMEARSLILQKL